MKKYILLSILLTFLIGCYSTKPKYNNTTNLNNSEFYHSDINNIPNTNPNFDTEIYIWEDFIFTTNKVLQNVTNK